jgi:hypothetical protein
MAPSKLSLFLPLLLITVGIGWLLTTLGIAPQIDWIWILGLAVAGVLAFAFGGFNKVSVVVGPFFLAASFLSLLRQMGRMSIDMEVPLLVILSGVLLLVARLPMVPLPKWVVQEAGQRK